MSTQYVQNMFKITLVIDDFSSYLIIKRAIQSVDIRYFVRDLIRDLNYCDVCD